MGLIRVRCLLSVALVTLFGCSDPPVATAQSAPARAAEAAPVPAVAPLEWPSVPSPAVGELPRPVPFRAARGPRFVIFGASWCPGCLSSSLVERELAQHFADRVQVGVALREDDRAFTSSSLAPLLAGVPVWTQSSTEEVAERCRAIAIPSACLVVGSEVLWRGAPSDGKLIIESYLSGTLDRTIARIESAEANLRAYEAAPSASLQQQVVSGFRGLPGRQNSLAWRLVSRDTSSEAQIALGLALARDAVDSTAGLDFAILDTYLVALEHAGHHEEAARVGARVIEVCDALGARAGSERTRAEAAIAR